MWRLICTAARRLKVIIPVHLFLFFFFSKLYYFRMYTFPTEDEVGNGTHTHTYKKGEEEDDDDERVENWIALFHGTLHLKHLIELCPRLRLTCWREREKKRRGRNRRKIQERPNSPRHPLQHWTSVVKGKNKTTIHSAMALLFSFFSSFKKHVIYYFFTFYCNSSTAAAIKNFYSNRNRSP